MSTDERQQDSSEEVKTDETLEEAIQKGVGQEEDPDIEPDISEEDVDPPLEPIAKWDRRYKEVFDELKDRRHQQAMLDLYKEQQSYYTPVEQERAELRRRWEPIEQALAPYQQLIAMSGATPDQYIRQALGLTMSLQQNPQATIQRLAQQVGLNLQELAQEQPYVDPQVQNLQQQLRRMQWESRQREETRTREFQERTLTEIDRQLNAFAKATDDNGDPKFPHFSIQEVQDEMAAQIRARPDLTIEDAYARACQLSPEVGQAEAREKRLKEAAARAAKAKKEANAAKRVDGKFAGSEPVTAGSIEDEILKNLRKSAA